MPLSLHSSLHLVLFGSVFPRQSPVVVILGVRFHYRVIEPGGVPVEAEFGRRQVREFVAVRVHRRTRASEPTPEPVLVVSGLHAVVKYPEIVAVGGFAVGAGSGVRILVLVVRISPIARRRGRRRHGSHGTEPESRGPGVFQERSSPRVPIGSMLANACSGPLLSTFVADTVRIGCPVAIFLHPPLQNY